MPVQKINSTIWVSTDTTGKKSKVNEIVKIPEIAQIYLPPELSNKQHLVLDSADMSGLNKTDYNKYVSISKNYETAIIKFMQGYLTQLNPGFDFVTLKGKKYYKGEHLDVYELKLNDGSFKNLIRYTVNNALKDKNALNLIEELGNAMMDNSNDKQTVAEINKEIDGMKKGIPGFLKEFNKEIDALRKVSVVSNKGIVIDFMVNKDGYIVKESGSADFIIKPGAIEKALNRLNTGEKNMSYKEAINPTTSGTVNLTIQFNTDISSINKNIAITMPKLNKNNSINLADLIDSSMVP